MLTLRHLCLTFFCMNSLVQSTRPSLALRLRGRSSALRCMGSNSSVPDGLSDGCKGAPLQPGAKLPLPGSEAIMSAKAHGTAATGVQPNLRWGCDAKLADRICCYNRHYAEVRRPRGWPDRLLTP